MNVPTEVLSRYIKEILNEDNPAERRENDNGGNEEGANQSNQIPETRSRGRPRIPPKWSRMISLYGDDLSKVRCYELATDLLVDNAMDRAPVRRRGETEWEPLFWPKAYIKELQDHTTEGNVLS